MFSYGFFSVSKGLILFNVYLFYVYACIVYVCVYMYIHTQILCVCLVPTEASRRHQIPPGLKLQKVVNCLVRYWESNS